MQRTGLVVTLCLGLFALAAAPAAYADSASFTFSGNFTYDNDVELIYVTLGAPESLLAYTTSGGIGGFPTFLMLFDADGNPVQQQSGDPACLDGYSNYSSAKICNDAYLLEPPKLTPPEYLSPGSYTIALVQWDNYWNGSLSDGFIHDGFDNRNFTNAPFGTLPDGTPYGLCGTGTVYFCDPVTMTADSSYWSLTVTLTSADGVPALGEADMLPEPGSAPLAAAGLAAAVWLRRRRRLT